MEPIITIDNARVVEGYYGTSTFTIRLSGPATDAVTVRYQALPQTAGWDDLYSTLSGTVVFNIGETAKTIIVRAQRDTIDESDEAYVLELRDPINATFGGNIHSLSALGWILDDDGSTTNDRAIAVSNPVVTEAGGGKATFLVSLSQPFPTDQSFAYRTYDISASAGSDYVAKTGRVTFLAGQTEATVEVDLINDNLVETAESFGLSITGANGVASAFGNAHVLDVDGGLPVLSVESDANIEGYYDYTNFTLRLSKPASDAVTVDYAALPQSATRDDLYSTLSGTVTFAAGETVKTISVRSDRDSIDEPDEAFILELRSPVGATFAGNIASLSTLGWIRDDDGTTSNNRAVAISDPIVTEAAGGKATFLVSLSEAFASTTSLSYRTQDGSAKSGVDYVSQAGQITFLAGQKEAVVEVDLINNGAAEATESFDLIVPGAHGLSGAVGTAVILDDDSPLPVISVEGAARSENYYDYIDFVVRLSAPASAAITVDYAALPKTASLEDLYSTISGTLTFEAGQTVGTISLRADRDSIDELDEAFQLELRNPSGATFGGGNDTMMALGWIQDDDGPFVNRTVAISDSRITEGPGGRDAVFAIELSQPHTEAITLSYRTVNVTAAAGADYAARNGTVTFEPGQTRVLVTVPILNDLISEAPETFQLRITPPYPTAISASTAVVWGTATILDGTRRGTSANETMNGTENADAIDGMGGHDLIRGLAGNDILSGGAGNDTLNGGAGSDRMFGGGGNDLYYVGERGDRIVEYRGSGIDTVRVGFDYQLGANLERLFLAGGRNLAGTGNALANLVTGNTGANVLKGLDGNDRLVGLAGYDRLQGGKGNDALEGNTGNDTLAGEAGNDRLMGGLGRDVLLGGGGNDTLNGGAAADSMSGGRGNDLYVVTAGDRISEAARQGVDTVQASQSWSLGANFEKLLLTGGGGINGTGNALANTVTGNSGGNQLRGLAGNDRLVGLAGNDRLLGGNGNDSLLGGNGRDTLNGEGGADQLAGGSGNDALIGGVGADRLLGGLGNDSLLGGTGNDILNGGKGADRIVGGGGRDVLDAGIDTARDVFVFNDFSHSRTGQANRDQILNFRPGRDDIDMTGLDANTRLRGDQDFDFNGTRADANAVWYIRQREGVLVRADHDGDARADFEIFVDGIARLGENDFLF